MEVGYIEHLQHALEHGIVTSHLEQLAGKVRDITVCLLADPAATRGMLHIVRRACAWAWEMMRHDGADVHPR